MPGRARGDSERVYDEVRRGIVEGRYAPGTRLIEQRVAEELDVSRTPVREAVRRLESEGLVVVERNRGAHVRPLSEQEIADLYEVRARLEAYGAQLAASRAEPAEVAAVRSAATEFSDAVDCATHQRARGALAAAVDGVVPLDPAGPDLPSVRRLEQANADFHRRLLEASKHSRIQRLVAGAVDAPLVFRALQRFAADELERSSLFHHLIADAVAEREPDRAGRLMTEHVLQGRDALLRRLSDAGGVADLLAREGARR